MTRAAAFFDVDGTIVEGDVVRYYAWLRTHGMSKLRKTLWTAGFLTRVPYLIFLDKLSRRRFQLALYKNYACFEPSELEARARIHYETRLWPRVFPQALRCIEEHKRRQEPVVLVTGSLRPLVVHLARTVGADQLVAPDLEVQDGAYTGRLVGDPVTARRKADAVHQFLRERNLESSRCFAYADSMDDLPFLSAVGHPTVVNPGRKLRRAAREKGWAIADWHPTPKSGRDPLPVRE